MDLQTVVSLPKDLPAISHNSRLLLLGSCFAENIGRLLNEYKFPTDINPFGILYNPASVAEALQQILDGKVYSSDDLFEYNGLYHSAMHHGSFSFASEDETLTAINRRLEEATATIYKTTHILLTWGTAWVYNLGGKIVGNCHKLPEKKFVRKRLSVNEITEQYTVLVAKILERNPGFKLILTVSPIRHIRDGMHENQLSKSVLLLAAEQLRDLFPGTVFYFPSYEIMMDELRDYRFYADDMIHPSQTAVQYIWERFSASVFHPETQNIMKECQQIHKAVSHRPLHNDSEEYKRFLGQIVLKIERLKEKYPNLDVINELNICRTRLKQ